MEAIYLLNRVIKKYKEKKRDINMIFIDLEKAYDKVPRDIIRWVLEKKKATKCYINVIRDMNKVVVTTIRSPTGETADGTRRVNTRLETLRESLKSKRFKISKTKTAYMEYNFSNSNNGSRGKVKIKNQELPKSEHFRYLGSIITTVGEIRADVVHRIKTRWLKWRSAYGVLYDK
ncbi:uncharacterized protein LOC114303646 [Camellia sinensis]|uniref:uncharacterized protein LOC114303646 n=1 Tax=Camellia sinensis TaxID=4442 RepID=UPI001035B5FB|nr:uncharacterized protein LOC114303646 [Camellia sinensis]